MIRYTLLAILFLLLNSCMDDNKTEIKLTEYKIKPSIHNQLNRVIKYEKNCPSYNRHKNCFIFSCSQKKDFYLIEIGASSSVKIDLSKCFGYFVYKNYKFFCYGIMIKDIALKTTNRKKFKYPNRHENVYPIFDDRYTAWHFSYSNGKMSLIDYSPCSS